MEDLSFPKHIVEDLSLPKYRKVVLYYPNRWRIETPYDKSDVFNWFICSKKYRDPKTGLDVAELSKKTKFYDENSGETLVLNPVLEKIVVVLGSKTPEKYGYQGYVITKECKGGSSGLVCKTINFYFLDGVLTKPKIDEECEVIRYSKENYINIKNLIEDFPSPEEIDSITKEFSSKSVCRVLYEYISKYFEKKNNSI